MITFIFNNYLEILLFAFTLGISAFFFIFLWPFKALLPACSEVEDIFHVTQSSLSALFFFSFVFIVVAKLFSIPLSTPFICLLPLTFFGFCRRIFVQGLGLQAATLGITCIVLLIALFELGSFISKWDGAAHQTMVTKMMAGNTLLLGNTYRLDERLEGYSIQPYYPYLIHSIIASITEGFISIGMRAQQCFLALSVVLPFLSLSAVVVTANQYSNNRKILYSFFVLLFSFTVPATFFTEVHHGSFARAIATVFGIGVYTQMLGDFRGRTLFFKAAVIVLAFAIHLQGAIFVGVLFFSEMICYGCQKRGRPLLNSMIIIIISSFGVGIFIFKNVFYMSVVNHDALHDLFDVWRTQVISSPYMWLTYSVSNLFTSQGLFYGLIKFVFMMLGCGYLWKEYPRILVTLLTFILACFTYVALLLYLPDGLLIKLLATPFAGAISRVYEGISIVIVILASVGILMTLNFRISSSKTRIASFIVVAWVVAPSTLVQFHLVQLAKTFDTILTEELKQIEKKVQESSVGKILIVSEDNRYMALDNGSNIRSYLSYFDCPLPYDESPECLHRMQFAKSLVAYSANNKAITPEMSDRLNSLAQNGYTNIYILGKNERNNEGGMVIYRYDFSNKIFLQSFISDKWAN